MDIKSENTSDMQCNLHIDHGIHACVVIGTRIDCNAHVDRSADSHPILGDPHDDYVSTP